MLKVKRRRGGWVVQPFFKGNDLFIKAVIARFKLSDGKVLTLPYKPKTCEEKSIANRGDIEEI